MIEIKSLNGKVGLHQATHQKSAVVSIAGRGQLKVHSFEDLTNLLRQISVGETLIGYSESQTMIATARKCLDLYDNEKDVPAEVKRIDRVADEAMHNWIMAEDMERQLESGNLQARR